MVDDAARERAIYHALKAVDEVAAALQAHLVEIERADVGGSGAIDQSATPLKLLHQARERLGQGLRSIEADTIHPSDDISQRHAEATG